MVSIQTRWKLIFGGMELCTPLYSSLQDEYSGMHIRFNFKLEGDEILSQNMPMVESDVGLVQDLHRIVHTSFIMYHWVYVLCTSTDAETSSWFQCIVMLVVWAFLLCFGAIPPMLCFFMHMTMLYKHAGTSTKKCPPPKDHEHQQQQILHLDNSELLFISFTKTME